VGEWRVDPTRGEIMRAGETARLEARTMRLLLCLAEHAGAVVSIDELLDQVWAGVAVSPDSVYQAVASLRRILGDDPKQPAYIATVPRLGYRMVALVEPCANAAAEPQRGAPETPAAPGMLPQRKSSTAIRAAAIVALLVFLSAVAFFANGRFGRDRRSAAAASTPPLNSVAVLPFLDLTEGMQNAEFADGITEELIDKLSRVPGLQVSSATASFYFRDKQVPLPQMAQSLGVASVLDGSVRKSQGWIRVDVRLVRAASGYVLWSHTYDQPEGNLLAIQDDIASAVTRALPATIGTGPH
jgi:transcriptional activator of cad operon